MRHLKPADYHFGCLHDNFVAVASRHFGPHHVRQYKLPTSSTIEDLACTVATFGKANASKTIVVSSGVNGVSLPFGSAMQKEWMKQIHGLFIGDYLKTDVRYVFVHALNPEGARDGRLSNRDNVVVNRNFWSACPPSLPDYDRFAHIFRINGLGRVSYGKALAKILWHGLPRVSTFKQILASGQYQDPTNLYYGGTEPSWSRRAWDEILQRHVLTSPLVREIYHCDIHTANGSYGDLTVQRNLPDDSPVAMMLNDAGIPSEHVKKNFTDITGDILDYWPQKVGPNITVYPFALNVGTSRYGSVLNGIDTLLTLMRRNRIETIKPSFPKLFETYYHEPFVKEVVDETRLAFYPNDPAWRTRAREQANDVWQKLCKHAMC